MQTRSILAVLLLSAPLCARAQTVTGAIRGVIEDPSAARVANASIDLKRSGSSLTRHVTADAHGEFRVEGLPLGSWHVNINAAGFATASADVNILVSSTQDVTVTMRVSAVRQTAGVSATASSVTTQPIDADSNVHQTIVSSADLEAQPLPARSFANIAYLAPGTEPVEPSDPTKARITAVSTGGSSGLNNELSVDGADDSDDYIGGFLLNISPDAVAEFAIRTAQEDADTGNTTAGSVVITTKSGNNQFHGGAAFYERTADLNARYPIENPAPNPKQPFSRQNYVGMLGGPIVKDKLWFFSAFENVHENASIAYSPASTTQFDALATLAADGLIPGVPSITVPPNVPIPFRDYFGSSRFDYAQSQRASWYLRSTIDNYTTHNNLVQQGTLPSTGLLSHNNYLSLVLGNQFVFSPNLLGNLVIAGVGLHLTQVRNSDLGFALAFPFSSTSQTISGFETYGDNQFATPITYFPSIRNQEKYQFRYDMSYARARHVIKFGINFIHEPVLGGAFPNTPETLYTFPENPTYYLTNPAQFAVDYAAGASTSGADGGTFSQNVQRFAFYAQDSWHIRNVTFNYGLHYSTTFGLFNASGRSQTENPGYLTLQALGIPFVDGAPHDDRAQIAPRVGFTYAPRRSQSTVIRGGFGLYFDDLAQNGWATAFQAVNTPASPCVDPIQNPGSPDTAGCVPGDASGGKANLIDPDYRTPYAIHVSGGVQHNFNVNWSMTGDFIHEQGNHGYRAYSYTGGTNLFTPQLALDDPNQTAYVPDVNVYHSDNRSSYNGLLLHLQGAIGHRANFIANYNFSKAQTWGCVLGELFDYVNGVCNPLNPFGPGDYGPSGEDVRHRFVLAGTLKGPAGFEVSGLTQAESARPFTITTPGNTQRVTVNNQPTTLDEFRATPYIQTDLRVSRPFALSRRKLEGANMMPFIEMFNVFNRNNPGANYVTNAASIPSCTVITPSSSNCTATKLKQLGIPGGALGDFFGPGTTVGIPFAAQLGLRLSF
jgi:Carboxypeptidase regulatory-like domain